MRITIISIGSELLIGHTVNTNLAFIGERLADIGYTVTREICIPDIPEILERELRREIDKADLVITIGGLGPTRDDMTRNSATRVLGRELRPEPKVKKHIENYLGERLSQIPESAIDTQSKVPEGATALLNDNGTAPGLWCPHEKGILALLPGPPRELRPMIINEILPRIQETYPPDSCRRSLTVCDIPESQVAEKLEGSLKIDSDIEIAYCARAGEVDIRLTGPSDSAPRLDSYINEIKNLFTPFALPETLDQVDALAELLTKNGLSMVVAESCTGGLISSRITEKPGASKFFKGGIIAYSNSIKKQMLDVPDRILEEHGAVSEETAKLMALGAAKRLAADAAIAITGIAGPEGGTVDKPVGLVYIATAVNNNVKVRRRVFNGNRERIRNRAATSALNDLKIHLTENN